MPFFLGTIGALVLWCICLTVSNWKLKRRMVDLEKFVDVALGNVEDEQTDIEETKRKYGVTTVLE